MLLQCCNSFMAMQIKLFVVVVVVVVVVVDILNWNKLVINRKKHKALMMLNL